MPVPEKLKQKSTVEEWRRHGEIWGNCQDCFLCETRKHVVLARGKIPCDVLFIGEAPGESEDVIGQPFIGPAGKLLDKLIEQSEPGDLKIAYTNVIGCFPKNVREDRRNVKFTQPPKEAVKACRERLLDFVDIVKPKAVVFAGKFAWDSSRAAVSERLVETAKMVMITHPAAILCAEEARQGIAEHQVRVILTDLFYEIRVRSSDGVQHPRKR